MEVISRVRNELGQYTVEHGRTHTTEHVVWRGMKQRCYDSKSPAYKWYGARGISVCDRWLHDFGAFFEDMGPRPKGMSLDRIDNDKGYSPENCRWATHRQQVTNTRWNRRLTINGVTKTMSQWIDETDIKCSTVKQRFYVYGWSIEESLGFTERRVAPSHHS